MKTILRTSPFFILLFLPFAFAFGETLSLKGNIVDELGVPLDILRIEVISLENEKVIDRWLENPSSHFELVDVPFTFDEYGNGNHVWITGNCFTLPLRTYKETSPIKDNEYTVTDGYSDITYVTTDDPNINLRQIVELDTNQLDVFSDIPVKLNLFNEHGEELGGNDRLKNKHGMTGSIGSNTTYTVELTDARDNVWDIDIETGGTCEATRIIKRGEFFYIDHPSQEKAGKVGIWTEIKLFFAKLFD